MSKGDLERFQVPVPPVEVQKQIVAVDRLRRLGYTQDMHGAPLERDDQVLELRVQDLVVPRNCGDYLLACARFVDDLLVRYYRSEPFYRAEGRDDLIGQVSIRQLGEKVYDRFQAQLSAKPVQFFKVL